MIDLTNPTEPSDTLIDYLTPPPTNQNFPPVQNNPPFLSTSNNVGPVQQPFIGQFPPAQQTAFSNNNPTVSDAGPPLSNNGPFSNNISPTPFPSNPQGFIDQNSNYVTPPTNFVTPSSFVTPQSREINNNFVTPTDQQLGSSSPQISAPPQGKWDLGFDASEILNPPLYDPVPNPSNGVGDYETLTLNTFPRRPAAPPSISSSASSNAPVLALNPSHSQFTIHGSLRANEHGQSIIWGTFKPAPFASLSGAASNDHLRYSSPPQDSYTPFSDSYLPQGTATDSFIPQEPTSSSSFRRRQAQTEDDEDSDEDKAPAPQVKGPVYSFVKTFKNGSFKWGVRQGALHQR